MEKNNYSNIINKLLRIEEYYDLFNVKIDDVYFWERIRFKVLNLILREIGVVGQAHTRIEFTNRERIRFYCNAVKYFFLRNPFLAPRSDILFFGSPRRKCRQDNKWEDIYCDSLIENLKYSYVYLEAPYLNRHFTPAVTGNIFYLDYTYVLYSIVRKLKFVSIRLTDDELKFITNLENRIEENFSINIDLLNVVQQDLISRKFWIKIFKNLLKRISPKAVILICSYGIESFIEACQIMNVPVIELQHGFLSNYHLGYSFSGDKRTKRTFPDYFLTFGDYWNNVADFPIDNKRVISVGYPYMENEIKKYNSLDKKQQVVFISQGTVGSEMSKIALELSEREQMPYRIVYKLHPGEYDRWRKEYPWLIDSDVHVVDSDIYPLYKIFAESKIQIGVSSTALFEGMAFGLKTILLPLGVGLESIQYFIDENLAVIANSVDDLMSEIINTKPNNDINITQYFKGNSLNNMKKTISDIIEKSN